MKNFLDLLRDIKENGYRKSNRTGVDTIAVVGRQLRFDLRSGFPLVTTRPIYIKALVHELLMFIAGITNSPWLNERDVHIWDKWAVKQDHGRIRRYSNADRTQLLATKLKLSVHEAAELLNEADRNYRAEQQMLGQTVPGGCTIGGERYLEKEGIPSEGQEVVVAKGELGPIYGALWRRWKTSTGQVIDQLAEAIHTLRTNPYSRRIIVSAWNPEVLPDESKSPEQNAIEGRQCLAACHTFFKFSVTPPQSLADGKGVLHLHLFQRSLDTPVGGPFNIASYSLLLAMVAQVTGLTAGEFIWTIDDAHIYVDQLELVEEQLKRKPGKLPQLVLNPAITEIDDFTFEDISIVNYEPQKPQIKYPVAI